MQGQARKIGELRKLNKFTPIVPPPTSTALVPDIPVRSVAPAQPEPAWFDPHLMLLFTLLCLYGAFLLASSILVMSLMAIDIAYVGFLLIAIGAVGISNYISRAFVLPKYNLWEILKRHVKEHLFVSSCISIGILMMNPWITLLGAFVGIWIEKTEPKLLIDGKASILKYYQNFIHFFSNEHLNAIANKQLQFLNNNKLAFIFSLLGIGLGISLYVFLFPWIAVPSLALSDLLIDLSLEACSFIMQSFLGGYLPGIGLVGMALSCCAITWIVPPLCLAASGGWLGFQFGKQLQKLFTFMNHEAHEKALVIYNYANTKTKQLMRIIEGLENQMAAPLPALDARAFIDTTRPTGNLPQYTNDISNTQNNNTGGEQTNTVAPSLPAQPELRTSKNELHG